MKKCHFIGIGGIGMSGLARLLLQKDIKVSGSDIACSSVTESLSKAGADIFIGHSTKHIHTDMTVVYSTDIKKDNPEFAEAVRLKCPMLHRSELLQKLMESYRSLAVAGTHGKTTTSSLLAWVFEYCGQSPTYAIGGIVPQLSSNSGHGSGKIFVAEACESDGSFLNYSPFGAIVTNIDLDHMDFYVTEESLSAAFNSFIGKVVSKKQLFWCGDDVRLQKLKPAGNSYGFNEGCDLKVSNFQQNGWMLSFDIDFQGTVHKNVEAALIGKHNALNVTAVFGLALSLGLDEKKVREALRSFGGVLRRCEKKGDVHGILFLDDYGHHPTEIKATLNAIRKAIGERRLVVAYQPHRYSRTKDCVGMYADVFDEADELFITEIYAARETPIPGISHESVVAEAQNKLKNHCRYVCRANMASELACFLRPHDVLVTLGAGDITKASGEVMAKFALKAPSKLKLGLIFGGMSVEHEISLISSANIAAALNQDYYEVEQFGITCQGAWMHGDGTRELLKKSEKPSPERSASALLELLKCDIVFPVLHGTFGEDGTMQGFLDVFSKGYVGCDHRSAAICMDKALSKRLVLDAGLPALPYVSFTKGEWKASQEAIMKRINDELIYPLFVKPVHLGSTIGVCKVGDFSGLCKAIESAFQLDDRLIVENGLENMREIEFSLLGNDEVIVFPPGEIYTGGNVHDYDSKYGLNPNKPAAAFDVKANLPEDKINEGMALAKAAYQTLGCCGMARVDTFLDRTGKFWFNEINPIPGFTKYSLYPLMCEANGLGLRDLIDRLVVLGLQRYRHRF
jgi:UDP-N-acetylmuramate--alanine ligase